MREKRPQPTEKEFEKIDPTWGEGWPSIENYSPNLCCLNPECAGSNLMTVPDYEKIGVGVQPAPTEMQKPDHRYAIICECPICYEKFWFHIEDDQAKDLKQKYLAGKIGQKTGVKQFRLFSGHS